MDKKRYFYITPHDYEVAKENGINRELLNQRVRLQGWDIERATTTPVNTKYHSNGKWNKWKDKAVVNDKTFRMRLWKGWSEEEAALTPKLTSKEVAARKSVFTEEQIKTAESNGVSKAVLTQRYHTYKWDIQKAITTPVMTKKQAADLAVQSRRGRRERVN